MLRSEHGRMGVRHRSVGAVGPSGSRPLRQNSLVVFGGRQHQWCRYFAVQSRECWSPTLRHFLDLSEDAPGPARRLAEHQSNIVRAATAGDVGTAWESALPCRR